MNKPSVRQNDLAPEAIDLKLRFKGVASSLIVSLPISIGFWFILGHVNNVNFGIWLLAIPLNIFFAVTVSAIIWPTQYYKAWLKLVATFQFLSIFNGCSFG